MPAAFKTLLISIRQVHQTDHHFVERKDEHLCRNLSFSATEDDLRQAFGAYGTVTSAIIKDKLTGKSRGFGFVEMPSDESQSAINSLNGQELGGRKLTVNEARPREDRGGGYGGRDRDRNRGFGGGGRDRDRRF
jgi:RNA recognition motif-containing protein